MWADFQLRNPGGVQVGGQALFQTLLSRDWGIVSIARGKR